jgi:hypothetical protein
VARFQPRIALAVEAAGERASRWFSIPVAAAAAAAFTGALAASDAESMERSAAALAGLGEGLTPAGDDFLVGALHALWLCRGEEAAALAGRVARAAAPRTTDLSAAWLAAAARGLASPAWSSLFAALGSAPAVEVTEATEAVDTVGAALERVLATGHSSGACALAGFSAALAALLPAGVR